MPVLLSSKDHTGSVIADNFLKIIVFLRIFIVEFTFKLISGALIRIRYCSSIKVIFTLEYILSNGILSSMVDGRPLE